MRALPFATLLAVAPCVVTQVLPTPSSWPHDYPGKPSGDFSPEWQTYFEVTSSLPNVTWTLPRSFSGNIGVNRAGHPNNTLFFWAFEKEYGSLTAAAGERGEEPWGIWLNGGPGGSSLLGLAFENGPLHLDANSLLFQNNFSWDRVSDYIWIDQPVGTGWSTTDSEGYVRDEDEMGQDFMAFLSNLVKVFPSLATRPLYLTGESYAGTYIPYIMKTYFNMEDPPVKVSRIAIGNGAIGAPLEFEYLPTVTILETYPQLIGYSTEAFEYFREQEHLCGYDLNLTYPQTGGYFPTLHTVAPSDPLRAGFEFNSTAQIARKVLAKRALEQTAALSGVAVEKREEGLGRRDLSGRANGTIDPWYGCFLYDEMLDYVFNVSLPWSIEANESTFAGIDIYSVPDALNPGFPLDGSAFFNDPAVRAAIHAPTSKDWAANTLYPFLGSSLNGSFNGDPSVAPIAFLTDLATNLTKHNIRVILYSGNDDTVASHRGTEVVIQNTTFGGIQGFSRRPSTPWFDDDGTRAGIVHQERNWTYVLIEGAGHLVPHYNPSRALTLVREFIFGNNDTGLVLPSACGPDSNVTVVGGEDPALAVDAVRGQDEIYLGSISTTATFVYPSATIAAWNEFIATATSTASNA